MMRFRTAMRGAGCRGRALIPPTPSGTGAQLRFLAIAHRASVDVARGENGNRRLGYTNVVLAEAAAPCPASGACAAEMPAAIAGQRGADRWAVLLQDRAGGRVHAVRWIGRPAK